MNKENICRLVDPKLIIAPHDKGSPPSWVPAFHGEEVTWVDREIFDKLKKLGDDKPCDICPIEIKENCEINKWCSDVTGEELKEFKNDIETQEKRVHERINPILELYDRGKIKRKELVEKLSEAFYNLERND